MSETTPNTTAPAPPINAEPDKNHQWLHKLVGEWTYVTDVPPHAGQPASKWTGTESVRALGGVWVLAKGHGEMPAGGAAKTLMTLGYDPQKKRFVGTWIGSMMSYLWIYDGELDSSERVLTLNSEGPNMAGDGTMAQYQDIIEFKSDDHRLLTARTRGADGTWQHMMTTEYRRTS